MAALRQMPPIELDQATLKKWGAVWLGSVGSEPREKPKAKRRLKAGEPPTPALDPAKLVLDEPPRAAKQKKSSSFDRKQSMDFGYQFDHAFGKAVASMLGGIQVLQVNSDSLLPPEADCMEVGKTRNRGRYSPSKLRRGLSARRPTDSLRQ